MSKKMINKKTWNEFRETGLLLYVNQILHAFGWAIRIDFDTYCDKKDDGKIKDVYPARVKFRGFDNKSVSKSYIKISKYLKDNSKLLLKESKQ